MPELRRTRINQYLGMRTFARMMKVLYSCSQVAQLLKWVNFMTLNYTSFLWRHICKPCTNKVAFYKSKYIKWLILYLSDSSSFCTKYSMCQEMAVLSNLGGLVSLHEFYLLHKKGRIRKHIIFLHKKKHGIKTKKTVELDTYLGGWEMAQTVRGTLLWYTFWYSSYV